jgi:hypothetical protein
LLGVLFTRSCCRAENLCNLLPDLYMLRFLIALIAIPSFLHGQVGGDRAFEFLRMVPSARLNALGGANISTSDHDPLWSAVNPAASNPLSHSMFSFSWANYLSDIRYGQFWYNHTQPKWGNFHGGVQFANYGDFQRTDVLNNTSGTFSAGASRMSFGASRAYDKLNIGATFHYLNANLDGWKSSAFVADFGASWQDTSRLLGIGAVMKNFGTAMRYADAFDQPQLPFELQLGISKRLEHLPLRFTLTGIHLNRFMGLLYRDENAPPQFDLSGQEIPVRKRTADRIARHFVFGAELNLSKHVYLRAGYNHLRRQDLKTINHGGTAGFGFGGGLHISWFTFDYGFGRYHAAASFHQFSLAMSLQGPYRKFIK